MRKWPLDAAQKGKYDGPCVVALTGQRGKSLTNAPGGFPFRHAEIEQLSRLELFFCFVTVLVARFCRLVFPSLQFTPHCLTP